MASGNGATWRGWNASEMVRSFLALFMLGAAFPVIFLAWHWLDAAPADKLMTAVFSLVTLIFGFYFGRQGVDDAKAQTAAAIKREVEVEESADAYESEVRRKLGEALSAVAKLQEEKAKLEARINDALEESAGGGGTGDHT